MLMRLCSIDSGQFTNGVRRIRDDDIKLCLMVLHELETISDMHGKLGMVKSHTHTRQEFL